MKLWLLLFVVVVMVILHHDIWFWTNKTLVLGFLPIGLAYHVAYSILASLVMVCLVKFAWPKELEDLEEIHHDVSKTHS